MQYLPIHPSLYSTDKLVVPLGNEKWSKSVRKWDVKKLREIFVNGRVEAEQIQKTNRLQTGNIYNLLRNQLKAPFWKRTFEENCVEKYRKKYQKLSMEYPWLAAFQCKNSYPQSCDGFIREESRESVGLKFLQTNHI